MGRYEPYHRTQKSGTQQRPELLAQSFLFSKGVIRVHSEVFIQSDSFAVNLILCLN